jgi:hypothetical protein
LFAAGKPRRENTISGAATDRHGSSNNTEQPSGYLAYTIEEVNARWDERLLRLKAYLESEEVGE